MPRVKIDYVVSFSSEDSEHPASNLLAWEVSKKKWLCKKGESSCSVVLQLTKAVKISAVHIGAYHSALVEVLVARSEKASDEYQVLVPSCVFVPLAESRRDVPVERVRSFTADQLTSDVRAQRWDRVRVVCSQPYNKHCKYGLSFIHIDEPGDASVPASAPLQTAPAALPQRLLALDTFSSDEDDFRPGELFANHLKNSNSQGSSSDTGAQIRQASSQILKNISDSSTKLIKTPITKPKQKQENKPIFEGRSDRSRDTLMYTQDEDKPHTKIDHIVQRHKDQKDKEEKAKPQYKKEKLNESVDKAKVERTPKRRMSRSPSANDQSSSKRHNKGDQSCHKTDDRKRLQSKETEQVIPVSSEPHTLLKDVVLVLSGYENPRRGAVRNTALAMGANVQRDWGPHCTHLICAFPNTPKLRQVRAAGGSSVPIVLAEWIDECSQRRQRLPWQWFATEPKYREKEPPVSKATPKRSPVRDKTPPRGRTSPLRSKTPPPRSRTPPGKDSDTECDTDEEIQKVLKKQKIKQQTELDNRKDSSPEPDHKQESMEMEGPSTDEDEREDAVVPRFGGALPDFFDGNTFVIDADDADATQLSRYVTAYGGLVIQSSQLDEDSTVDYAISARARPSSTASVGQRVTPAWLARCHRAGALLPPD